MVTKILQSVCILFIALIVGCGKGGNRQTIVYRVEIPKTDPRYFFVNAMTITVYNDNGRVASDWTSPFLTMKTVITDTGTLSLTNAMGNKLVAHTPPIKSSRALPFIRYTNETRVIAGYTCTKAIVKLVGEDSTAVWCAAGLPAVPITENAWFFKELKGMPLEVTVNKNHMDLKLVAEKVTTGPIADSVFHPSTAGYTDMKDYMKGLMK